MDNDDDIRQDRGDRQADAERLMADASRLAAKAAGRAREEVEDIWAEAQALRHREPGVGRRGLVYGIAGLINVGERLASAARGAAEGARASQDEPPQGSQAAGQPVEQEPVDGRATGDHRAETEP